MQHRPNIRDFRADLSRYLHLAMVDSPDEVIIKVDGRDYRVRLEPLQAMPSSMFDLAAPTEPTPPSPFH